MTQLPLLRQRLEAVRQGEDSVSQFQALVQETMEALGLTDREVALALSATRTTVNRWRNCNAAPHPITRKAVYAFFARRVNKALAHEQKAQQVTALREAPEGAYEHCLAVGGM